METANVYLYDSRLKPVGQPAQVRVKIWRRAVIRDAVKSLYPEGIPQGCTVVAHHTEHLARSCRFTRHELAQ